MAILVRYTGNERDRAIYLSYGFYRRIYWKGRSERSCDTILREIALLKYKGPTLTVGEVRLQQLICDLKR